MRQAKKKINRILAFMFALVLGVGCLWGFQVEEAMAADRPVGCGSKVDMDDRGLMDGQNLFITLADSPAYRWNVNGTATRGNVVHLDKADGGNCKFSLYDIGDGWYGIKYEGASQLFADIEDKSEDEENKVLHLWEDDADEVIKSSE